MKTKNTLQFNCWEVWLSKPSRKWFAAGICLFLFGCIPSTASDLIEVLPVTNKILQVYLKDGFVDHYGLGQAVTDNKTYGIPTNLTNATALANYQISSTDDANYLTAKSPIALGRKSKGVDYNDQWSSVPYVWGHWMYIELPQAMLPGKTYTLKLNNLVENKPEITWVYDVNKLRSPTVHVNMVGFSTKGPKYAYLSQWMGDFNSGVHQNGGLELDNFQGGAFRVLSFKDGKTVFSGTIAKRMDKTVVENPAGDYAPEGNYSHADVWQCDFSQFETPGEYVVAVDGIGCSYPFEIGNNVTREPFYYSMKGLFWQRQGIVKEIEQGKLMPRDHHPDDITWRWDKNWPGGEDNKGFNEASPIVKDIWGYYHDAGDWDGYNRHNRVPMKLLLLFDLQPSKFKDGDVGNRYKLKESDANWIDEGKNGLPDLLDEASWLISYYKRARNVLKNNYGGTGGVPGYVGRDALPGNNYTAWQDTRLWYLSAENLEQTYAYAGLASWYAICLNEYHQLTNTGNHPDYQSWLDEGIAAWTWANAKTAVSEDEQRARGFAAACLFRATGVSTYQTAFEAYLNWDKSIGYGEWSSPNYFDLAASVYVLTSQSQPGLNKTLYEKVKGIITGICDNLKLAAVEGNAFRNCTEKYQFFSLGSINTVRQTLMPVLHTLTGDEKYLNGLKNCVSYALGGNQMNMVYISRLGEYSDTWLFTPNAWLVNDYNSKVYTNGVNIGYTSYYGDTRYWFYTSSFSEYWSRTASYPDAREFGINKWPEGEGKFTNQYSIQGAEFTIEAQNAYMIYAMGYVNAMSGSSTDPYTPNSKPTVSLNLTEGGSFPSNGCNLSVNASSDTRSVKYYYDWHYIGESTDKANNFALFWDPIQTSGSTLVTAVGYDDRGFMTSPSPQAEKNVTISVSSNCTNTQVSGVTLNASNLTIGLCAGASETMIANVLPVNATNKSVTWASSNTNVATVSSTGILSPKALGITTITVTTVDGGFSASTQVTVVPAEKVSAITFTGVPSSISIGNTLQLIPDIIPANACNKNITYTSNNDAIATVDANGLVKAISLGNVTINATAEGGASSSVVFNVVFNGLEISKSTTPILVDGNVETQWNDIIESGIAKKSAGVINSPNDLSATVKSMWDNTYLYLLIQAVDDNLKIDAANNPWDDDSFELYVDAGNEKSATYDANDKQLAFKADPSGMLNVTNNTTTGIKKGFVANSNGYIIELAVPWSLIGITPMLNSQIGLEFSVNDRDNATAREGQLSWNDATGLAWQKPSVFGTAILKGSNVVTGLDLDSQIGKLSFFPNPVSDLLTLSSDCDWILLSSFGQELKRGLGSRIDFSVYDSGLYFIKVGKNILKVIKK